MFLIPFMFFIRKPNSIMIREYCPFHVLFLAIINISLYFNANIQDVRSNFFIGSLISVVFDTCTVSDVYAHFFISRLRIAANVCRYATFFLRRISGLVPQAQKKCGEARAPQAACPPRSGAYSGC